MAAAGVRMVFDTSGNLVMIVKPDNDAQLNDPAFAPHGTVSVIVPKQTYDGAKTTAELLTVAAPIVTQADAVIGAALNQNLAKVLALPTPVPPLNGPLIDPLTKLPYPIPVDAGQVI